MSDVTPSVGLPSVSPTSSPVTSQPPSSGVDSSGQISTSLIGTTSSPGSSIPPSSQGGSSSQNGGSSAFPSSVSPSNNGPSNGGSSGPSSGSGGGSPSASASVTGNPSGGGGNDRPPGSVSVSGGSSYVYVTVTNSNGQVTVSTSVISTGAASGNSSSNGSSHTGAIVGGVVGGVAGIAILSILVWFLLKRKRSHRDDFDDMMFDPGRPENQGPIDLGPEGEATVEPYYAPGVASTGASPEMTQYPRSAATTSDGGYGAPSSGGPPTSTSTGFAGLGAGGAGLNNFNMEPMPMPTAHPTGLDPALAGAAAGVTGTPDVNAMTAKQREAYQESQRYKAQNSSGPSNVPPMSPTPTDATGLTGITVHRDGGAVEEDEPQYTNEIPPTYESIGQRKKA
ncbi:uncharacterized protein L203_104985 [Cryptococcus depauperatus CBS 7841]|uniref:Uncharacterized protein n=1 Tax=Cryptococcus depauperatus CBS 7841 TaxID=1295531 RepID=A0AAJ8M236_9TREE